MGMSKIHLHVEQLSLPGYTPAERREFIAALERELAIGVASTGMPREAQSREHDVVRVTSPDLRPQSLARSTALGLSSRTGNEAVK
jgi:hypothetical protein